MLVIASWFAAAVTIVAAIVPAIDLSIPGRAKPEYPAPPGYLLPWAGGEIHSVTQGEETTLTHNGTAAYAFDFDLNYETVIAARGGKVAYVRDDSNSGGCDAIFAGSGNYVVIDHGDGTSGLYLHLAYDSVLVKPGDIVHQGDPLAISGETGLTCGGGGDDHAPGPHLHFQVERTEADRYFTQSLPIAFDDIPKNDGVPVEGESYMSGNYGRGQPQKIKLTPWRVPREFNPVARPENPILIEALPDQVPPPPEAPPSETPPTDAPVATAEGATPASTNTPRATRTPTVTVTGTATPIPSDTATPTPTATATATTEPPTATDTPAVATAASEPTTSGVPLPPTEPAATTTP